LDWVQLIGPMSISACSHFCQKGLNWQCAERNALRVHQACQEKRGKWITFGALKDDLRRIRALWDHL